MFKLLFIVLMSISVSYMKEITDYIDSSDEFGVQKIYHTTKPSGGRNNDAGNEVLTVRMKNAEAKRFERTGDKERNCHMQEVVYGYNYENVYTINEDTFTNSKVQNGENGIEYFELNFALMALKDGIIMLSSMQNPTDIDPVFEIGKHFTTISPDEKDDAAEDGACLPRINLFTLDLKIPKLYRSGNKDAGNEFHSFAVRMRNVEAKCFERTGVIGQDKGSHTEIRRRKNKERVLRVDTPDILSSTELRDFYMKIHDGNLEVGKKGQPAFLNYENNDLKFVKYVSFATWGNRTATILFDCPAQ